MAIHAYLTSANNNLYLFKYTNQGINAWSDSITNINLFYGIQTGTSGDFMSNMIAYQQITEFKPGVSAVPDPRCTFLASIILLVILVQTI
ncbi:MAG: hypothetical protein IPL22_16505 [Bacteroidetes bacterium]|nr:hypothetical protein [Bacteroidota bacterium]